MEHPFETALKALIVEHKMVGSYVFTNNEIQQMITGTYNPEIPTPETLSDYIGTYSSMVTILGRQLMQKMVSLFVVIQESTELTKEIETAWGDKLATTIQHVRETFNWGELSPITFNRLEQLKNAISGNYYQK